jgi:hypothetical protein
MENKLDQKLKVGGEIELPTPDGKTDGPKGTVTVTGVDPATGTITVEQNPHSLAPASVEPSDMKHPVPAENTGDSRDTDKLDSLGNAKEDAGPVGPRGANVSPEHLSEAQKAESAEQEHQRLQQGMSSTDRVDSVGNAKGHFVTEEQGLDEHGARIPDKVTDELVDEHPPQIGPRGRNTPLDTFHGNRRS